MNERIEELSLQCIRYKLIAEGARSDFDYKKFAELIVQECANIDFRRKVGLTDYLGYEIGKVIKSHFGVEE